MYKFSKRSLSRLNTCHMDLVITFVEALKYSEIDISIIRGHSSQADQKKLFMKGRELLAAGKYRIVDRSKVVTYLDGYLKKSKHNFTPALACDFCAYVPGRKDLAYDRDHLVYLAGILTSTGRRLKDNGIITSEITWGCNWDRDGIIINDHNFNDLPHIQINI